jgi:hypothetical protein
MVAKYTPRSFNLLHPAGQQLLLLRTLRAIGVVGGETLRGENVQAGKESQSLFKVEVVDVTAAFFVQQLQRQKAQERGIGRDHLRTGIVGLAHQSIKPELCQQRQEQKQPSYSCPHAQGFGCRQHELPAIGDSGKLFPGSLGR